MTTNHNFAVYLCIGTDFSVFTNPGLLVHFGVVVNPAATVMAKIVFAFNKAAEITGFNITEILEGFDSTEFVTFVHNGFTGQFVFLLSGFSLCAASIFIFCSLVKPTCVDMFGAFNNCIAGYLSVSAYPGISINLGSSSY